VLRQQGEAMRDATFEAGSIIYEKGATPRNVYFVVSGRVRLADDGQEPFYFDKNSAIGGLDALQDIPHSRTATAMEETRCLLIPVPKYYAIIEDNHDFAKGMIKSLLAAVEKLGAVLPMSEVHRHEIADPSSLMVGQTDRRLGLLERLVVLRQAPLFGKLRSQMIVKLAETLEERTMAAGEVLLRGGESSDSIWIVATGLVEVQRIAPESRITIGPGNAVSIFAAMGDVEENYRATATVPTRLLRVRKVTVQDAYEDHPDQARISLAFAARERARVLTMVANLNLRPPTGVTSAVPSAVPR